MVFKKGDAVYAGRKKGGVNLKLRIPNRKTATGEERENLRKLAEERLVADNKFRILAKLKRKTSEAQRAEKILNKKVEEAKKKIDLIRLKVDRDENNANLTANERAFRKQQARNQIEDIRKQLEKLDEEQNINKQLRGDSDDTTQQLIQKSKEGISHIRDLEGLLTKTLGRAGDDKEPVSIGSTERMKRRTRARLEKEMSESMQDLPTALDNQKSKIMAKKLIDYGLYYDPVKRKLSDIQTGKTLEDISPVAILSVLNLTHASKKLGDKLAEERLEGLESITGARAFNDDFKKLALKALKKQNKSAEISERDDTVDDESLFAKSDELPEDVEITAEDTSKIYEEEKLKKEQKEIKEQEKKKEEEREKKDKAVSEKLREQSKFGDPLKKLAMERERTKKRDEHEAKQFRIGQKGSEALRKLNSGVALSLSEQTDLDNYLTDDRNEIVDKIQKLYEDKIGKLSQIESIKLKKDFNEKIGLIIQELSEMRQGKDESETDFQKRRSDVIKKSEIYDVVLYSRSGFESKFINLINNLEKFAEIPLTPEFQKEALDKEAIQDLADAEKLAIEEEDLKLLRRLKALQEDEDVDGVEVREERDEDRAIREEREQRHEEAGQRNQEDVFEDIFNFGNEEADMMLNEGEDLEAIQQRGDEMLRQQQALDAENQRGGGLKSSKVMKSKQKMAKDFAQSAINFAEDGEIEMAIDMMTEALKAGFDKKEAMRIAQEYGL